LYGQQNDGSNSQKLKKIPSKKMIANGLLLLGGLICLSQGNTGLSAKVAIAFVLMKLSKRGASFVPKSTKQICCLFVSAF
jgi:hypothetical protein